MRGFWVADAKTMCFDLNEGVQEDFRPVTPSNDAEKSLIFREKRESQRAEASRLSEKATSPFSPSLRLWKPWKTEKRFTHRSHSLRSPSFSSLAFSLYKDKCPFSIQKTHSCHDEQRAAYHYGKEKQTAHRRFYPQKKPQSMTKKKPSTTTLT